MHYLHTLKKVAVLIIAVLAVNIFYVTNSTAQLPLSGATGLTGTMATVAANTYNTMNIANSILALLQNEASGSIGSNSDPENNGNPAQYSFLANNQQYLQQLGEDFASSMVEQDSLPFQVQLFSDLLGMNLVSLYLNGAPLLSSAKTSPSLPNTNPQPTNVNNLAYSSLLGQKPYAQGNFDPYEYLRNITLIYYNRPIPDTQNWQGKADAISRYQLYFNTITALQSYNNYLLSQNYADYYVANQQGTWLETLRENLTRAASQPNFLIAVSGESMGKVMRQILIFESQNFVLNVQNERHLRDLVGAASTANSLHILFNMPNENQLIRNAKGLQNGQ